MEFRTIIIKFYQSFDCLTLGSWGGYIRTERLDNQTEEPLFKKIIKLSKGDNITHRITEQDIIPVSDTLIFHLPISTFSKDIAPETGMIFRTSQALNSREKLTGMITKIDDHSLTLDCNFPKIGQKNINTTIKVIDIFDSSEVDSGKLLPSITLLR